MLKHLLSSSLLAVAVSLFALPAAAAESTVDTQTKSVTVAFGDLNTSSKLGAEALLKRIEAAAKTICGSPPPVVDIKATETYNTCVSEAVERAVASAGLPTLTAALKGDETTTLAQQ